MAVLNIKNLPDELYAALRARARAERRSLSQEVVRILEREIGRPRKHKVSELKGLGKDLWRKVGVDRYLERERRSWD
jgi:plasmid stability protein